MALEIITDEQIQGRDYWVDEISRLSGNFGVDAERVEEKIGQEIAGSGIISLLGHLRLCGVIPERYGHDTKRRKTLLKIH